ncbi:endonuclease domain-containing protein [Salinimicrobium terrae]|uniref:endonuclease domain-containing protein n=1 Tax=Salinimicrobium terrae TaxID=470866 RepID=UPI00068690AB|nr:endonuclease domain-containing protein [Salinimicrobium terrae]
MKRRIHNRKRLEPYRKKLRHHGTTAEAYLWKHLQQKKLDGRKFRRQHSVLNFIVDFYCAEERLVIELDGLYHMNPTNEEKDALRTRKLEELNLKVIRFENRTVFENLDWVLEEIKRHFGSGPPRLRSRGSTPF